MRGMSSSWTPCPRGRPTGGPERYFLLRRVSISSRGTDRVGGRRLHPFLNLFYSLVHGVLVTESIRRAQGE